MNVRCPACGRLYRIADERVESGATLRCTGCGHQFGADGATERTATLAAAPGRAPAWPRPAGNEPAAFVERRRQRAASSQDEDGAPVFAAQPAPPPPPAPPAQAGGLAILADAGRPFRSTLDPVLTRLGFEVEAVEDGTEAFRLAVTRRPNLIVASVHLAGLSGVAICEGVKQSPHLREISVVMVGSQDTSDLFNHDTALAYGADLFLDESMRPAEMYDRLRGLFAAPGADVAADVDADDIAPALAGLDEASAAGTPREEIRRLARIMLSDLRLYNPDRFRQALDEGRLLEVFKVELARGRDIVDQRFPDLSSRQDQLASALHDSIEQERLAAARG